MTMSTLTLYVIRKSTSRYCRRDYQRCRRFESRWNQMHGGSIISRNKPPTYRCTQNHPFPLQYGRPWIKSQGDRGALLQLETDCLIRIFVALIESWMVPSGNLLPTS